MPRSSRARARPRPTSTSWRCPAASTPTCSSRPRRSAWPRGGTRSARPIPQVNQLFGDIIKVTPSSKVVGDMALFVVANNLTSDDVLDPERELAFPESVVEFFEGRLGQPPGGFPPALQARVLEGPAAAHRAARRQSAAGRLRRRPREGRPRCSAGRPATARRSATCSIPASSPTWPPTSGPIPTRRSCRRRSSSSVPTRRPSTWSRSSRARR